MAIYCADCRYAKISIVSAHTNEGVPIYYLDADGEVTHKVKCLKKNWKRKDSGVEQLKSLVTLRRLKWNYCLDYLPGDMEGAAAYRYSLPENHEDYLEWRGEI